MKSLAATLLASAFFAALPVHAADECNSAYCLTPKQLITAQDAWRMKQVLGKRAVLIDIRGRAEAFYTGMPLGIDAQVPYMEPAPGFVWNTAAEEPAMEFRFDFALNVDEVIRAAHVRHDEPVILLAGNGERGALAAILLQEHGYSRVYVVSDGFEGRLVTRGFGSEERIDGGWKNSGLPWTAHVMPRWLALEIQR